MLAQRITNHVQQALGRLLQQYKGQPNLASLITVFVDQVQDLEDAIYALDAGRQLANATGAQLDGIGQLVNVARNGLSDVEYKIFILGTIAENFSDTTLPTVLNIATTIFQPIVLTLKEMFPAEVGIGIGGSATGLAAGQVIRGGQFPSGTTINSVVTQPVSQLGHIVNGSSQITNLNTATLVPGMLVTGATFSNTCAIISIDSPTQVTVTNGALSATGNYLLTFSAVLSMSANSNVDAEGAIFQTLDSLGNIQNTFTGNTRQGAPGITDFQVEFSDSLQVKIGNLIQNSLGAGIALGFLTFFDAANSFTMGDLNGNVGPAYAGSNGFGDVTNPSTGGEFASLIYSNISS